MMRLLYFTEADGPHDQRFLRALAGTQHDVYALRQRHCDPVTPEGIIELDWPGKQPEWKNWGDWGRGRDQLEVILERLSPDLVHAGSLQGPAFLTALTGFEPLVSMSWGSDLLLKAKRSPWMHCVTKYVLDRTQIFLGDCQTVADAAHAYGFSYEKMVRFPWGVDLDLFSPENGASEGKELRWCLGWEDNFVILCNRSWMKIYGVDVLARAFVRSASINEDIRLLLLGNGPQSDLLHEILKPVQDKVHFGGWIDRDQLPGIYCAADLFVSPSHCDGSSISLLEALACGRPVLVSDIPSNQEWVKPGEAGELFEDGNPQELSQKILDMADAPNLEKYSITARRLAEKRANWDHSVQKLLQAYQMAL